MFCQKKILYRAESPTRAKMILAMADPCPKMAEIKSTSKKPTSPQLSPPMRINTIVMTSITFICFSIVVFLSEFHNVLSIPNHGFFLSRKKFTYTTHYRKSLLIFLTDPMVGRVPNVYRERIRKEAQRGRTSPSF